MTDSLGHSPKTSAEKQQTSGSGPAANRRLLAAWWPWGLLTGGVLLSLAATAALFLVVRKPAVPKPTIEQALQALEEADPVKALQIASAIDPGAIPMEAPLGLVPYVRGMAYALLADSFRGSERQEFLRRAAHHLQEAVGLGLSPDLEPKARIKLAKALVAVKDLPAARQLIGETDLSRFPKAEQEELILLYADVWAEEDPTRVIHFLDEQLATHAFGEEYRDQLLLRKAWALGRSGQSEQAIAVCQEISEQSPYYPRAKLLEALVRIAALRNQRKGEHAGNAWVNKGSRVAGLEPYAPAIQALEEAIRFDNLTSRVTAEALYWLGVCHAEAGALPAAKDQWQTIVDRFPRTAAAVASAWNLGQLAQQDGQAEKALEWYQRALAAVGELPPSEGLSWLEWSQWYPGPALEDQILNAYRRFLEEKQFDAAVRLAEATTHLLAEDRRLRLKAEALRSAGEMTASAPDPRASTKTRVTVGDSSQEDALAQSRRYFRQAGITFLQLAQKAYTQRDYPDYLWAAADCFRKGRSWQGVLLALSRYEEDQPVRRRPFALLYRGEALLALGRTDEALQCLEACFAESPRSPAAFEARLLAAYALAELGRTSEAEGLLRQNLDGQELTPASREWRESLLALGELLLARRAYAEARDYLLEHAGRYSEHPQSYWARYLAALARLQQGRELLQQSRREALSGAASHWAREAREHFLSAAGELQTLMATIQQRSRTLPAAEEAVLIRNAELAWTLAQCEADSKPATLQAVETLLAKYANQPEAAPFLARLALGWTEAGNSQRASQVLAQARALADQAVQSSEIALSPNPTFWQQILGN
jgi:tetratricopeptide (TPR) repeat protein